MGKGCRASGEDLDERVGVLDFVGVLLCVRVHTLHALTIGGASNTGLCGVDVIVETIESTADDHGRKALGEYLDVVKLVDLAGAHRVVTEGAHSPADGTAVLQELCTQLALALGRELFVAELCGLGRSNLLLVFLGRVRDVHVSSLGLVGIIFTDGFWRAGGGRPLLFLLDDGVVGNIGPVSIGRGWAFEEQRAQDEHPPLDRVVPPDNLCMHKGNEEDGRQEGDTSASAHGDGGNKRPGLLVKAEAGSALVDDEHCANGTSDEEEGGRGVDGPGHGILAHVHNELDEHEDGSGKAGRNDRSHPQTGEDGTKTLAVVPVPLDLGGPDGRDTDAGDGRDERVGRRDVSRVSRAPHDP